MIGKKITFKDANNVRLSVVEKIVPEGLILVEVYDVLRSTPRNERGASARFTTEQAPELALAFLQAAGYSNTDQSPVGGAYALLLQHIEEQAEAKEREELEQEAKALCAAAYDSVGGGTSTVDGWVHGADHNWWLSVARKARELYGKGEN